MNDVMAIGIAGGTGSGKTTITNVLRERFKNEVSVIYHDDYYKAHDDLSYEERCLLNYDHPDAFETERLIKDLEDLKNGKSVFSPVYDFTVHNRSDKVNEIKPSKVIILEGILIFTNEKLLSLLDVKLFVDTDPDVRILRRMVRDIKERNRSVDSVAEQYLATVKPMHEKFVEPSKKNADLIIPEGGHNAVALDFIINRIEKFLNNK